MRLRTACLSAILLVLGAAATARAQAPPLGGEFQVNTYTTADQDFPAVAVSRNGTFVIAWQSYAQDGSDLGVFAQRYDAAGAKDGPEMPVNVYTTAKQFSVAAGADAVGTFTIAWQTDGQDGYGFGIRARRIFNNGTLGSEFEVNTYTTGGQYTPDVGVAGDASFVIVWSTKSADKKGIFGQRFGGGGLPIGTEFQVNAGTGRAKLPSIAMAESGDFVVVWHEYLDGSGQGVSGQRFDSSGAKVGPVFPVNTYTTGDQNSARVAMGKRGDFVVVWTDYGGEDGDSLGVFGQRFNASGEKIGAEFQVNTNTQYAQYNASVGVQANGGFVVSWNDVAVPAFGAEGQRFDRTGAKVGTEFRINVATGGLHQDARVAAGPDTFVAAWAREPGDGANEGVLRARTNPIPQPLTADKHSSAGTTSDLNAVLEPGETARVEPAWKNVGANAISRTGTAVSFTGPGAAGLYHIDNASADYGSIPAGAAANCYDATPAHDCYRVTVDVPATRPATHWDATLQEDLSAGGSEIWKIHVADSFSDVPRSQPFYVRIESLLHYGITTGCSATAYCPGDLVHRDQMAIFIAKSIAGTGELVPTTGSVDGQGYDCSPGGHSLFGDVPPADVACKHVHYLARQNVTLGCNAGLYCPGQNVTRDAMASFIAKAVVAPKGGAGVPISDFDPVLNRSYDCDPGSPFVHFTDVPATNPFCKHIHYLWAHGIVSGCSATLYCPSGTVARDAMAKFIANAFNLTLYPP
jgi:hypothetical protein